MVLTTTQAEQFKSGTLTKRNFIKLMLTYDFEQYLYRYCEIYDDSRDEDANTRTTIFKKYGFLITVFMENGKCKDFSIKTSQILN